MSVSSYWEIIDSRKLFLDYGIKLFDGPKPWHKRTKEVVRELKHIRKLKHDSECQKRLLEEG